MNDRTALAGSRRARGLVIVALLLVLSQLSYAGGKFGIYGIRMVPHGTDAQQYSDPGWGGGLHAVIPLPSASNIIAGTAGLEIINLLSETETFTDGLTGLRVEQHTDQTYFRLFMGAQVGGHGNGFFRPHAGINLALVYYEFRIDIVVPDDYDRERDIRQNLDQRGKFAFGYDVTLGLDLNFSNTLALDGGVRYLKSVSVPQQLGEGTVRIHPQYFQIYLGVGIAFEMIQNL
jgi:opacity protein-like surface antigen